MKRNSVKVRRVTRVLVILAGLCAMASCIMIPVGGGDPHPFSKKRLAFIKPGVTGQAEVRTELGTPQQQVDEKWWLYRRSRKAGDWMMIVAAGYAAGAEEVEGGVSNYQLLIGFHSDGTVLHIGVFKDDDPCDKRRGICYQGGKVFIKMDPDSDPGDDPNCGVYYKIGDRKEYGCIYGPV